jgi:mannosyltransferase OCH1-like enzyme
MRKIPKIIYQVSIGSNHNHQEIQKITNIMLKINSDYEYKLLTTEKEMDNFVSKNFDKEIVESYHCLNFLVAKIDFWKYLNLYKNGGIYLDMDSLIINPLDELIRENDDAIISADGNRGLYVQWCLIFTKEHPILKQVIEVVVDNIKNNKYPNDVIKMTGSEAFSEGIQRLHFLENEKLIDHSLIKNDTDISFYTRELIQYRIYSINYGNYCLFTHNKSDLLFMNKKSWYVLNEMKLIKLLK